MIIVLHVTIALLSIISATYGYSRPTTLNLKFSYAFILGTFASGFYMVWVEPAQMVRTCLTGIAYLAVVSAAVVVTRRKLAALEGSSI